MKKGEGSAGRGSGGEQVLVQLVQDLSGLMPPPFDREVRSAVDPLTRYLVLLLAANREMNLLSRTAAEPRELVFRHLDDALRVLPHLPPSRPSGLRVLDIGSGGGFPVVPIMLIRKDLSAILVESTGKKARFLERLTSELGLTCRVVNARFPDSFPMREVAPFDLVTTRAVARAGRLLRSARPVLGPRAKGLLWTTRPLFAEALDESGFHRGAFYETPGTERRGIGVVECST